MTAGLTFRSLALALAGLVAMAVMVQLFGVVDAPAAGPFGTEAFPLSALNVFFVFALLVGGTGWAFRRRLVSGPEMLCVVYVLMMAAPLMSTGFWRFQISAAGSVARLADWEKYDSLSPQLWPHGPDLLAGRWNDRLLAVLSSEGRWEQLPVLGKTRTAAVLSNRAGQSAATLRVRVPVRERGRPLLPLEQHYLLTGLFRASELSAQSRYYVRIFHDASPTHALEVLSSRQAGRVTFLQPEGFVRDGNYGFVLPAGIQDSIVVEVGLSGPGVLTVGGLELHNVQALESVYAGVRQVTPEVFATLPEEARIGLVVLPERWWSWAGLKQLATGYVPWAAWRDPLLFWGGVAALMLISTFTLACLFRPQWIQSERFPLPMTHLPVTLSGNDEALREGESYLRNPALWLGFGLMFLWAFSKAGRAYLPGLPDLGFQIAVKSYLSDPGWGAAWNNVLFNFSGLMFAIGLFVELNVLLSLVLGFVLYRLQFWVGESQGLSVDKNFPYTPEQGTGAFLAYGVLVVVLARKFLAGVLRKAWGGGNPGGEILSPRAALLLLAAAFVGMAALAVWAGLDLAGTAVFIGVVLLALLVAMKFRAECGSPGGGMFHKEGGGLTFLFLFSLCGSFSFFSPGTFVFMALFTGIFISNSVFALIPGLQLEWVALGHRMRLRARDVVLAGLLGIAGGLVIGGWVYFNGAYAVGAANYPVPGHFMGMRGNFSEFNTAASKAAESAADPQKAAGLTTVWFSPQGWSFLFGAGVTTVLTVLRQWFAGFWFHPLGFVMGPSQMMHEAWGSLLLAWAVRLGVLKVGGAAAVRHRLYPFAVGCVIAIIAASLLFSLVQTGMYFFSPGQSKFDGRF
jgi:hypothetical protein